MSQFLPEPGGQGKQDAKGPESYLSNEERKALQRELSFPEDLPPRFKSWILDHVVTNIQDLPVSQLSGFRQIDQVEVTTAQTIPQVSGSPGVYSSLSGGPELTGLRDGLYVISYGFTGGQTGGSGASMSVSVNGATATDDDWALAAGSAHYSVSRTVSKTLNAGTNTITLKYKVFGPATGQWRMRWLVAQRIGPVPDA